MSIFKIGEQLSQIEPPTPTATEKTFQKKRNFKFGKKLKLYLIKTPIKSAKTSAELQFILKGMEILPLDMVGK